MTGPEAAANASKPAAEASEPASDALATPEPIVPNARRIALIGAGAGLLAGLVIAWVIVPGIAAAVAAAGPSVIEAALEECDVTPNDDISVGDDGASLSMQTAGEETDGADIADVSCVLFALDVPDSVVTRIDSTRALDGRQTAAWNELEASWGYHPDNGLDIVIEPRQN